MRFPLPTRYSDYDSKGHVNNALYLTYFELAKHLLWRDTWHRDPDPPFVVVQATVRYASPAMLGDPLQIDITVKEVGIKSWTWRFRVTDRRDERLVADGETVQVYYDYASRQSMAIPDEVRVLLESIRE